MYTQDSLIVGPVGGTVSTALAAFPSNPITVDYLNAVFVEAPKIHIDPVLVVSQADVETASFTSDRWTKHGNPAGLGITSDAVSDPAVLTGPEAALCHLWCLSVALHHAEGIAALQARLPAMFLPFSQRWLTKYKDAKAPVVKSLKDLCIVYIDSHGEQQATWAMDQTYGTQIAGRANKNFPSNASGDYPRIIVNPGHRNTTGGDPEEAAFTPQLADAYHRAFLGAGIDCVNLGDTQGSLDVASQRIVQTIAATKGQCVFMDLHLEGSPALGAFAIVPDVTGLVTNAPVAQDPADTWTNNSLDRKLARAIVDGITKATGLTERKNVREDGIMDEDQTGVGESGYRLAVFGYTSPQRLKAVRLVVEHGNHTIQPDHDIIFSPGFADRCANAAVDAVKLIYGDPKASKPPIKQWAEPHLPDWWQGSIKQKTPSDATFEGNRWHVLRRREQAIRNINRYSAPNTKSPKSGPLIPRGSKVQIERMFYDNTTKRWWMVEPDGHYLTANALAPKVYFK